MKKRGFFTYGLLMYLTLAGWRVTYADNYRELKSKRILVFIEQFPEFEPWFYDQVQGEKNMNVKLLTRGMVTIPKEEDKVIQQFLRVMGVEGNLQGYDLEQLGRRAALDWVYKIWHEKDRILFVLYSVKIPLYVGFSFLPPKSYLQLLVDPLKGPDKTHKKQKSEKAPPVDPQNKSEKKVYVVKKGAAKRFIRANAFKVLQLIWQKWPFFKDQLIFSISPEFITVNQGGDNSLIHHKSIPLIVDREGLFANFPPLGHALLSDMVLQPDALRLPVKAIANRFIIGDTTTRLTSEGLKKRIKMNHISKSDILVLANTNLFIKFEQGEFFLIHGIIPIDLQNGEPGNWEAGFEFNDRPSVIPLKKPKFSLSSLYSFWQTGHRETTGMDLKLDAALSYREDHNFMIYHIQGIQGDRDLNSRRDASALGYFRSGFQYSYMALKPTVYFPSIYTGFSLGLGKIEQWLTNPDIVFQRLVSWLGYTGILVGLGMDINRHRLRLTAKQYFAWGVDIVGSAYAVSFYYAWQMTFLTNLFIQWDMQKDSLDWDDYNNQRHIDIFLDRQTFSAGLSYELPF